MKLASFVRNGPTSYGAIVGNGIVDLGGLLGKRHPDLKALLAADALGAALAAGDVIEIEIDRVGVLRNTIALD